MGAPISEATLDTLHDMPKRVPRRERSGVMFAKAAEGTVTRAAEKKPRRENRVSSYVYVQGWMRRRNEEPTYPKEY